MVSRRGADNSPFDFLSTTAGGKCRLLFGHEIRPVPLAHWPLFNLPIAPLKVLHDGAGDPVLFVLGERPRHPADKR